MDAALVGFTESLELARRLVAQYGETPQTLRDLSVSLNDVAAVQQRRGELDAALRGYRDARCWVRLLQERFPQLPPETERIELLEATISRLEAEIRT